MVFSRTAAPRSFRTEREGQRGESPTKPPAFQPVPANQPEGAGSLGASVSLAPGAPAEVITGPALGLGG